MELAIAILWGFSITAAVAYRKNEDLTKNQFKACLFVLCVVTGGVLSWFVPHLFDLRENSRAIIPD